LELDTDTEGRLLLKAGLTSQYMVFDRQMVELTQDAYSNSRAVIPQQGQLQLPLILNMQMQNIQTEVPAPSEGDREADIAFYPDLPRCSRTGDQVDVELSGAFQTLYYDENGKLQSLHHKWHDSLPFSISQDNDMQPYVSISGLPQGSVGPNGVFRSDVLLSSIVRSEQGLPMLTGLELGEIAEQDPGRPSLILRKFSEQSLWDMAKKAGTTVDAILEVNHLEKEPSDGQMLLIPVL